MKRTTVMLPESYWLAIKEVARRQGRRPSDVIRDAVATYVADKQPTERPSFVGMGASGRSDTSSRVEDLLGET